jgi:hypothetical protein
MRRVALALGLLGFLVCCWIAVIMPGDIISGNLRRQREFERVVRDPLVQRVLRDVSRQGLRNAAIGIPQPKLVEFEGRTHSFPPDFSDNDISNALKQFHGSGTSINQNGRSTPGQALPSEEVSLIRIGNHRELLSFEKIDGTMVYRPEVNTPWTYLSFVLLPICGFGIPWSIARGCTWVVSGFLVPSKQGPPSER